MVRILRNRVNVLPRAPYPCRTPLPLDIGALLRHTF